MEHTIFPWTETPTPSRLRTPKRERANGKDYRYYAGFSRAFVGDIIDHYVHEGARVLDPWNGSGTTTTVCAERGIDCVGMDINPGTLAIAWSRFARADLVTRLCESLAAQSTDELLREVNDHPDESLASVYFKDPAAAAILSLRNALIAATIDIAKGERSQYEFVALSGAAFALLAQVISQALRPLRGTNPSWFVKPKERSERIDISPEEIRSHLDNLLQGNCRSVRTISAERSPHFRWPELLLADSKREMAHLGNFDVVITSPPYCTRIDYAVATVPELIALGQFDQSDFDLLRSRMMGSVVTEKSYSSRLREEDSIVGKTLRAIHGHHTKAAATYYSRYFSRYFDDLLRSLDKVASTVVRGHLVFVLQNSYFKDVEIDLTSIVGEHLSAKGFRSVHREDHPSRFPIAGSNPKYRHYRNSNVCAETVFVLSNV